MLEEALTIKNAHVIMYKAILSTKIINVSNRKHKDRDSRLLAHQCDVWGAGKILYMKINTVIDDSLMAEALKLSNITTKEGVLNEALKLYVQVKKQETIREQRGKWYRDGNYPNMGFD